MILLFHAAEKMIQRTFPIVFWGVCLFVLVNTCASTQQYIKGVSISEFLPDLCRIDRCTWTNMFYGGGKTAEMGNIQEHNSTSQNDKGDRTMQ